MTLDVVIHMTTKHCKIQHCMALSCHLHQRKSTSDCGGGGCGLILRYVLQIGRLREVELALNGSLVF